MHSIRPLNPLCNRTGAAAWQGKARLLAYLSRSRPSPCQGERPSRCGAGAGPAKIAPAGAGAISENNAPSGKTESGLHRTPGSVRIAAGRTPHRLRPTIDIDLVDIVAAVDRTAAIGLLRDHLAVAPIVGIAPAHRTPGLPAFPGIVFGLLGKLAIARVERATDLIADNAAD